MLMRSLAAGMEEALRAQGQWQTDIQGLIGTDD
jgi:hypothetical protein